MRRALVCLGLLACSRTERAPAPDPAPPPAAKTPPAIDAAAPAPAARCQPMVALVDDAPAPIVSASAVTVVDGRRGTQNAVWIYVWFSPPPSCEQLRAGSFASAPRYALLTYPLVANVPMTLGAPNTRGADATIEIDRGTPGTVGACVLERASVAPEWDGAKHRLALEGSIAATDCGSLRL